MMRPLDPLTVPLIGTNLIEASAGTGKTYTIASLYLRLVVDGTGLADHGARGDGVGAGLSVEDILVVTFTEAATAELRDRIRARLRLTLAALEDRREGVEAEDPYVRALQARPAEARATAASRLTNALQAFDLATISTIHGFCHRALLEHAFESGVSFDAELIRSQQSLIEGIAADAWVREVYEASPYYVDWLREAQASPKTLQRYIEAVCRDPGLRVSPDLEDIEVPDAEVGFLAAYGALRGLWRAGGEQSLADFLLPAKRWEGGKKRAYATRFVGGWIAALDEYLSAELPPGLALPKNFERFTYAKLQEATEEGYEVPRHEVIDACEAFVAAIDGFEHQYVAWRCRLADEAREALAARKREQNVLGFDDLLTRLDGALAASEGETLARSLRERHRAALIDEFQDTDAIQYRIFKRLFASGEGASAARQAPLFLIGDPKQSIYRFRGADIFAYLGAARDAGDRAWTLGTNWRSDRPLVEGLNRVFSNAPKPFVYEALAFHEVAARPSAEPGLRSVSSGTPPAPVQLRFVERRPERVGARDSFLAMDWLRRWLPGRVAVDAARLLAGDLERRDRAGAWRPLAPGDIAVIVRSNAQAGEVQLALRARGIPSVVQSAGSVYQSAEADELLTVLRAVASPGDEGSIRGALATELIGLQAEVIAALRSDDRAWERWSRLFIAWHERWVNEGFYAWSRALLSFQRDGAESMEAGILAVAGGERRLTNLRHLGELLHDEATRSRLGPQSLLRWFERQRQGEDGADGAGELRLESDARAVRILTVHKSKGLQFPVVLAPYAWSGRLPESGATYRHAGLLVHGAEDAESVELALDRGDIERLLPRLQQESMAEELRLLYVALTRAEHLVVTYWGGVSNAGSPLGYLLHPGADPDVSFEARVAYRKGLDDAELLAELEALSLDSAGRVSVVDASDEELRLAPSDPAGEAPLRFRAPLALERALLRSSSYSTLTRGHHGRRPSELEGLDRDEAEDRSEASALLGASPDEARVPGLVALHDFPRGSVEGECMHAVFEHADFQGPRAELEAEVRKQLTAFDLEPERWTDTVTEAFASILETDLDEARPGLRLGAIPTSQRLNELRFRAAVGSADAGAVLSAARLGDVFERFPAEGIPATYAEDLARLDFAPLRGFLSGFIDLVFEHEGRFHVLDYKSNHLGSEPGDYGAEQLLVPMLEHHYLLQVHLYQVALHRYLSYRLKDYDYDRHVGPAYYLFLRGMSAPTGPSLGVYRHRPTAAMIQALSEALDAGSGRAP